MFEFVLPKLKPHLVGHLGKLAERYGLLIFFATETMESLNGQTRVSIVRSNHIDTSSSVAHDSALRLAMQYIKTGFWLDDEGRVHFLGKLVHALLFPQDHSKGSATQAGAVYFCRSRSSRSHRNLKSLASDYAWPMQWGCDQIADLIFKPAREAGFNWPPSVFETKFIESFRGCFDKNAEPIQVGWSVLYETADEDAVPTSRRGRVLDIIRVTDSVGVTPVGTSRCFAILARYDYRLDSAWRSDFDALYQLTAEQQVERVSLNRIMCALLRLSKSCIDIIPTSSIAQSFHAQHSCSISCVVTNVVCEDMFAECPRRVEKGHRLCVDDGFFFVNSYLFSDPLDPVPYQSTPATELPSFP